MAYETITKAEEVLDVLRSEIGASASDKKAKMTFYVVLEHICGVF